jgi:histidinol dehydrogenase
MSVIEYDQASLEKDAPDVEQLAIKEGLTAHLASVKMRLSDEE